MAGGFFTTSATWEAWLTIQPKANPRKDACSLPIAFKTYEYQALGLLAEEINGLIQRVYRPSLADAKLTLQVRGDQEMKDPQS